MQVKFSPYTYYPNSAKPNFKSNEDVFVDKNGVITNKTMTFFFRDDLDWQHLGEFLEHRYKNSDNVNITDYGCSDGSEAYTIAMTIFTHAPHLKDTAFPIIAKDNFPDVLEDARSGKVHIYNKDIYSINYYTKNRIWDFMQAVRCNKFGYDMALAPKPVLQDKIIFEQGDILEDLDNLPEKNNVIFCRNFWKYFDKENYHNLAAHLYEKTKDNGLVVIGNVEERLGIPLILNQHGFTETSVENVYAPVKKMAV